MNLSTNPHDIIHPKKRWRPSITNKGNLLHPPLVELIREEVYEWRHKGYPDISNGTKSLLKWWFIERDTDDSDFKYYFCQREAIESVIYLYECKKVRSKTDLLKYDKYNILSEKLLSENWLRLVIKMATGSGKTKVMSLALVWSYFHKTLVPNSILSTNFLILAPYVIVLERLEKDFGNNSIFNLDPLIPDNDYEDIKWKDLFQIQIHIQNQLKTFNPKGNIFLTNVQRIYSSRNKALTSKKDSDSTNHFLGKKEVSNIKKGYVDLRKIIKNTKDLFVMNDEAHHIHDAEMAWSKTIEDINNNFVQNKKQISLQLDFTATPKDQKGNIFPQVICDYPLVEAIHQNMVKRPILPSKKDQTQLKEEKQINFAEKYSRYIDLGVKHWRKAYEKNQKVNKKSVLFIMADETKSCEEIKVFLKSRYKEFMEDESILVIHTNKHGEFIEEKSAKSLAELKSLRRKANSIDENTHTNPCKVVVSVLMLKEGWDVKNVTTIVGLRSFTHKAEILPEQTIGRGLRRMFPKEKSEKLAVIGTENFMVFIDKLQLEGVIVDTADDDDSIINVDPIIVEIDTKKDLKKIDIQIPILKYRLSRDFSKINEIDIDLIDKGNFELNQLEDQKEYTFTLRDILTKEIADQITVKGINEIIPESIIGFYAKHILKQIKLAGAFNILYPKLEEYISKKLFTKKVNISDVNVLKNLRRDEVQRKIIETFVALINEKIVVDTGKVEVNRYISVCDCPAFRAEADEFIEGIKTPFNLQVGNKYELEVAQFISNFDDILSFTKNFEKIGFYMEYQNTSGLIRKFYPDFLIKISDHETCILETKGREDDNDKRKHLRLIQWCNDMNSCQNQKKYIPLYIKQDIWNNLPNKPLSFKELFNQFQAN